MEGWVGVSDWLHTEIYIWHQELNPDMVTHLSTNWNCHTLTSVIKRAIAMPDRHRYGLMQTFLDKCADFADDSLWQWQPVLTLLLPDRTGLMQS